MLCETVLIVSTSDEKHSLGASFEILSKLDPTLFPRLHGCDDCVGCDVHMNASRVCTFCVYNELLVWYIVL